jgi:hypothetical protein
MQLLVNGHSVQVDRALGQCNGDYVIIISGHDGEIKIIFTSTSMIFLVNERFAQLDLALGEYTTHYKILI